VENILANTAKLKGKQKESIEANADKATLSKNLATIIRDVPIEVTWDDLILSRRDDEALKNLFNEFEFRTFTKRLFGDAGGAAPAPAKGGKEAAAEPTLFETFRTIRDTEHTYHLAETPEQQAELFTLLGQQPEFCFDVETTSLNRFEARLLGIAFSWKANEAWYLPYSDPLFVDLKKVLSSPAKKIGHNLKYDLSILTRMGIAVGGEIFDTMLADTLVAPERRHSMDYLSETLLGYTPVKLADLAAPAPSNTEAATLDLFAHAEKSKASKELDVAAIPLEILAEYAAEDADVTWQLYQHFWNPVRKRCSPPSKLRCCLCWCVWRWRASRSIPARCP
jgi:DNA polymerase-1